MHKQFRKLLYSLRKHFAGSESARDEIKRAFLAINIILFAGASALAFSFLDFMFTNCGGGFVDLLFATAMFIGILMIMKGYINAAKILTFIIGLLCFMINSSSEGRLAGNQCLWFPFICSIFIFYSISQKMQIIFSIALLLTAIIFMEYTDYSFLGLNNKATENLYRINSYVCMSISLFLVFVYFYYMMKTNQQTEDKLKRINSALNISNQNLKKTNSELDSFVYKASHDLRSPLVSLLGLIEISKNEKDFDKVKQYLLLKERSVKKLDALILDILDLSKNARLPVEATKIDFELLINEIFNNYNYLEDFNKIERKVNIERNGVFFSDVRRLNIIMNNLISNSIRYADIGKPNPYIDVQITIYPTHAFIHVKDNGQGIKEEHIKKIYNMYFRANERNTGSGLGLYIVKETLEKLKGSVEMSSEYMNWTEFQLMVPNMKVCMQLE